MSDGLWHNSMLGTMKTCEQKYKYRYIDGLERGPGDVNAAMLRGTWFHALMQAQGIRQGVTQETLLELPAPTDFIDLGFDGLDEVMLDTLGDPTQRDFVSRVHRYIIENVHDYMRGMDEEVDALPEQVWSMYERYLARHVDTLLSEKVLGVEVQWQRDYKGAIEVMPYGGKVDRIVQRSDGLVIVRDHKTTGRKPTSDARLVNSQLHLYAWGVAPWLNEHGLTADAIEYDYVITKKVPDVKLTKAGKLYKTSLGADPYSLQKGILDLGLSPNDFTEVLDAAEQNWDDYFSRNLMPVSVPAVRTLLRDGEVLAERDKEMRADRPAVRSSGLQQCDWCEYRTICSGDMYGNDTSLLKDEMRNRA